MYGSRSEHDRMTSRHFNLARWIRTEPAWTPWYLNYYGSQCYQDRDQGSPSHSYYDSQVAAQQQYFSQFKFN